MRLANIPGRPWSPSLGSQENSNSWRDPQGCQTLSIAACQESELWDPRPEIVIFLSLKICTRPLFKASKITAPANAKSSAESSDSCGKITQQTRMSLNIFSSKSSWILLFACHCGKEKCLLQDPARAPECCPVPLLAVTHSVLSQSCKTGGLDGIGE